MTMISFFLLLAVGFGVGYDVKTKDCMKKGCEKIEQHKQDGEK